MSEPSIVKSMREVVARAKQLNDLQLVVGIPSDGNTRSEDGTITNAELGAVHEFGSPDKGIPERSFMRSTASEESSNLGNLANNQVSKCLKGETSPHDAYAVVGTYFQGKIVDKITDGDFEPDSAETIKRKKSSKPLIDTGQLRASITYEVRDRDA